MSWCPKCKQEFQDGITVCPTCDETLVEKLDTAIVMTEIDFFSEEEVNKFISFLAYSNIKNASFEKDSVLELYRIKCEEENRQEVLKLFRAFKLVEEEKEENPQEAEEALEDTKDSEETTPDTSSVPYVKKKDQYSDVSSTGYMLVVIGILGLAYVGLNFAGILHLLNGIIAYGLNIALFTAALIYGVISLRQASQLKGQIAEEEEVEKTIMAWLDETVTEEFLEKNVDSALPKEANFLKQFQAIKKLTVAEFPDVKENFIESLIDLKMNEE